MFDIELPTNSVFSRHSGLANYRTVRRAVSLIEEYVEELKGKWTGSAGSKADRRIMTVMAFQAT